jgi:septal ring factor EnvC (AmiA/AmiB activator)
METEQKTDRSKGRNSKTKAILIMSIIIFAVGFGLGFYVFGYHKQSSTDYKENLREVISYIDSLEKERKELSDKLKSLEALREPVKPGVQTGDTQPPSQQGRLEALERENASLRSNLNQNQVLLQENYELRVRVKDLEARQGEGAVLQQPLQPQTMPPQMPPQPR